MSGNIKKDKQYRANLLENIGKDHPINKGFFMQIHHLISAKAVRDSGIGPFLMTSDYNINHINNLVALPSTLEGACHLEAQLHRGDHKVPFTLTDNDDEDDDNAHPDNYHDFIINQLDGMEHDLLEHCGEDRNKLSQEIIKEMDSLSKVILKYIANFKVPLTDIYKSFQKGHDGCRNSTNIDDHRRCSNKCTRKDRDHKGDEHSYSKKSGSAVIDIDKKSYKLEVGK